MIKTILQHLSNRKLFSTNISFQSNLKFQEIKKCIIPSNLNYNNNINVCYISDLHIELYDNYPEIKNDAEILILTGNIGNPYRNIYINFLKSVSKNFKKIFLITGNYEYYFHGNSIKDTDKHIENIIQEKNLENIIFLNNKIYDYNNFRFIGTTLWSKINDNDQQLLSPYFNYITDFNVLKNNEKEIIKNYNTLFDKNYEFLKKSITESHLPIVAITHNLPSYKLIDVKYLNLVTNKYLASNCEELMTSNVLYWFYGNTHKENDCIINNTRLLCNSNRYSCDNYNIDKNKKIILKNTFNNIN
jgi:hypothetical protein